MYSFKLKLKKENRGNWLIFALPQTNHYQTITNLSVNPKPHLLIKEKHFSNQIAIFNKPSAELKFLYHSQEIKKQLSNEFEVGDYENNQSFRSSRFINGNDKKIKEMARQVINEHKTLNDVVNKLYYFSMNYLTYGKPIDGLYPYNQALKEKTTDCGGFSTFLASLLQSQGIPCRLVIGYLIKKNFLINFFSAFDLSLLTFNSLFIHTWLELKLPDNSWFPLDSSVEWRRTKGLSRRQGGFGHIPADRLVVSYGEDFNLEINGKIYQIDLLQKPFSL